MKDTQRSVGETLSGGTHAFVGCADGSDGTETVPAPDYMNELANFLLCEYNFKVQSISPAKRGFYGETWNVQTEKNTYFVKIDYWSHHKESFCE